MIPLPGAFRRLPLAHRALHGPGRPENSRAAVRAAIDAGYGIEIDLQLSSDGEAMVFHDDDLARLTGRAGALRALDSRALAAIPLTGSAEGIPPLGEILDIVAGRVPLLIELKDQHGRLGAGTGRLEQAAAAALRGYAGPVALMSFNPHSVRAAADHAPGIPRGLVTCAYDRASWPMLPAALRRRLRAVPDYDALRASFVSHQHDDLASPVIADLKRRGAAVLSWTIRTPEQEAAARRLADNITFEGYAAALPG